MPFKLLAAPQQRLSKLHRSNEPLPARDDLERMIALLVKLHVMRDRPRLSDEITAFTQQFDDARARFWHGQTRECVVITLRVGRVRRFPRRASPRHAAQLSVRLNDRAHRQRKLAPPGDIGHVAECTDHRDARPFFRIGEGMRVNRYGRVEQRRPYTRAEERLVPAVVRMRDKRDACGNQFGASRLDFDRAA